MRVAIALVVTVASLGSAHAQASSADRGEVFASLASSYLFRAEDRSFGHPTNIGGGVRVPLTGRLGVEVEGNRALRLRAEPARCGVLAGCEGSAREGVLDLALATANIYVRFPHGRVEPFLVGGVGVLWARSVHSLTTVRGGTAVITEVDERNTGLAIGFGGGAAIAVTRRWSVRPEIRIYDSTALSRSNLSVIRTALGVGYRW